MGAGKKLLSSPVQDLGDIAYSEMHCTDVFTDRIVVYNFSLVKYTPLVCFQYSLKSL